MKKPFLASQIAALKQKVLDDLCHVYNFAMVSSHAYSVFAASPKSFSILNFPETGFFRRIEELPQVLKEFQNGLLNEVAILATVSIFDGFFFDLLRPILLDNPLRFDKGKKIDVARLVEASDLESVWNLITDNELNELRYKNLREWFKYLERLNNISFPSEEAIGKLCEIKATRDILVHNSGIVNKTYTEKAGSMARSKAGEKIEVSPEYFHNSWDLIRQVSVGICSRLKFPEPEA